MPAYVYRSCTHQPVPHLLPRYANKQPPKRLFILLLPAFICFSACTKEKAPQPSPQDSGGSISAGLPPEVESQVLKILRANSTRPTAFPVSQSEFDSLLNQEKRFLSSGPVKGFPDFLLRIYGGVSGQSNGKIHTYSYFYGTADGKVHAEIMRIEGWGRENILNEAPIYGYPVHAITFSILGTIQNWSKSTGWNEKLMSFMSVAEPFCETLKTRGYDNNGFSFSGIHVRGWCLGDDIVLEFVPEASWAAYLAAPHA